ncbi:MAG: (d)CMP kinase [Chlamydiae bacterium]|nr:(d)CMP kinase [Chlamydiota bacterium]
MIVTIDGPSGTGKSTMARRLAGVLNIAFFDTGALYRSLAWWLQHKDCALERVQECLKDFVLVIQEERGGVRYFVGEQDVSLAIRSPDITLLASKLAAIKEVREALLPLQRDYAKDRDVVFEGRDIGSIVFPAAEIKIFLTASPEVRAERRYKEMKAKGVNPLPPFNEVLLSLQQRDTRDSEREVAPLLCPKGAFVLDTSSLTQDEVLDILVQHCKSKQRGEG